jgi:2-polyprenyl-3-methyl-5-hydroxy-6-metoxy-1,4-benzoquinol methylase
MTPASLSAPAFNPSYIGAREDVLGLIDRPPESVLDVGCATGKNGELLRHRYGSQVTGIEFDSGMASLARDKLFAVHLADLNKTSLSELLPSARYDLIVFGDVLEHLIDPWTTLSQARSLLKDGGTILTSLPNVGHYSTLLSLLLFRRWPYRERGIHDRTHLRFFTRRNLLELYAQAGLTMRREERKLRLVEAPSPLNRCAKWLDFPPFRYYLTFQYIHLLGVAPQAAPGI